MATYGLVHGAFHGSWCWRDLRQELEGRGHDVRTVDLPAEDPAAGAAEYARAAAEAFDGAPDDIVLVGHSLGGLTIPVVATLRPVGRLVYLCAMLPRPGRSHDSVARDEPDIWVSGPSGGTYQDPDGATHWIPEAAAARFFSGCPPATASWAAGRLRGQCWTITAETTPLTRWPDVPTTAIVASLDRVINPVWSRRTIRTVLEVEPIELDSDHSPFLSTPRRLADILIELAASDD